MVSRGPRTWLVGLAAVCALSATAACGLLIGLEDHEAYPAEGGVVVEASTHDGTMPTDGGTDAHGDGSVASDAGGDAIPEAGVSCEASCGDACVDLQSDNSNCGTCGFGCDGSSCYRATCGGATVTQLTAGTEHACALLQAGDVWCWGADDQAQILGPGDASACPLGACRPAPARIGGLPNAVQVSAGGDQTCALDADGGVWCWGSNAGAGLGHSPTTDPTCTVGDASVPCNAQPAAVAGLPGPATTVTSGQSSFACALVNGSVYCWGDDSYDELGPSGDGGPSPAPQLVLSGAAAVNAGFAHACALVGGVPTCWGSNASGELGHTPGSTDQTCINATFCNPTPQALPIIGILRMHPGYHASCFETAQGPYCLGANDVGQLGLDSFDSNAHSTPAAVTIEPGTFTNTAALDFGYKTACALAVARVYCWGDDETHQTSDPASGFCTTSNLPCALDGYRVGLLNVAEIRASTYATFARTTDGRVWSWGNNGAGQLGHAPGDAGDEGGCDLATFPSGTDCNEVPLQVLGLP
jgi:alpha-tubulin suppressor-like RCC1 family protein